jgi:O-antigen ligase
MAVPLAGYLFFRASSKKALWGIIFLVILVTDLLTFSRGGYVGLLFGSFVFFLTLTTLPLLRRQVFIVLLITMASLALLSPTPFGQRLFSSFSSIDTSNMERLRLWGEAVAHISERPLLGVGLGNYPLLLKPSATYREPIYAHNLYLDISLELGLIGLTFFLGIIGSAFIAARRFWHKNGDFLALTLMISLSIFSAHSLFDTALYSVHVLPTLIFLLALATTLRHRNVTLTV